MPPNYIHLYMGILLDISVWAIENQLYIVIPKIRKETDKEKQSNNDNCPKQSWISVYHKNLSNR